MVFPQEPQADLQIYTRMAMAIITGFKKAAEGKKSDDNGQGGGISSGVNFAFSQNVKTRDLRDINGDGLPDFVSRSGGSGIEVYLNTGGTFETSMYSWGNGFNMSVLPAFAKTNGLSEGLETSNTGSVGGTVGVEFHVNAGPVSGGCRCFNGRERHCKTNNPQNDGFRPVTDCLIWW